MTSSSSVAVKKYIGPQIPSLLSYLLQMRRGDPPDLLHKLAREYGNLVHLSRIPRPLFFVTGPAGVEHILQSNQHNYQGFNYSHVQLRPLLGNGLLTSEGDIWLKHRRLAQQAFHKPQLEKLSRLMAVTIRNFLEGWETRASAKATLDIGAEMGLLTLGVVSESLFGTKMGERAVHVRDAWPQVMDHLVGRMVNPVKVPEQLPFYGNRQYQKSLGLLNEAIYTLISEHRAAGEGDENLLGMLIAARDQKLDIQLDDQELRDEVMTVFLAGHETCANALTWTLYLLARHPEVQERLAEEAATVLAGREPSFEDLPQLPYAAMVFNEGLRLYPPAWIMARDVLHEAEIEGWHIPAGSLLFLSPYVTHRLPEHWETPLRFNPEHFSPEQVAQRPRFAYFPFGGGQRQCIGKNFALIEAQLALPMLAQKYRLSLQEPLDPEAPYPTYNMRPQKPILLKLERR
jgi:cytochrome P450